MQTILGSFLHQNRVIVAVFFCSDPQLLLPLELLFLFHVFLFSRLQTLLKVNLSLSFLSSSLFTLHYFSILIYFLHRSQRMAAVELIGSGAQRKWSSEEVEGREAKEGGNPPSTTKQERVQGA
jgi:hypothetical protein